MLFRCFIIYFYLKKFLTLLNKIKSMDEHARKKLQKVESLKLQWDSNTTRFLFFFVFLIFDIGTLTVA